MMNFDSGQGRSEIENAGVVKYVEDFGSARMQTGTNYAKNG